MEGYTNILKSDVKKLLNSILTIRIVEEQIIENYSRPGFDQEMRCPVHLSIGQEAAASGVCGNLSLADKVFSTHRCHAHYLAKGGNLRKMILELHGKSGGCLDGRGGSMHLMDNNVNMVASIPIVSSSIPLAVGSALADKIDGKKTVTVSFFGDASMEEGVYHESANFASVKKLPVIFVCENNLYSVYTHIKDRQPDRQIDLLGSAHGLNVVRVDGNNVFEVFEKFKATLDDVRLGNGPYLFLMDTYRYREHCGVNFDNKLGYRDPEEIEVWENRDPVKIACEKAIELGHVTQHSIDEEILKIEKLVKDEFEYALSAPLPDPTLANKYIYAN